MHGPIGQKVSKFFARTELFTPGAEKSFKRVYPKTGSSVSVVSTGLIRLPITTPSFPSQWRRLEILGLTISSFGPTTVFASLQETSDSPDGVVPPRVEFSRVRLTHRIFPGRGMGVRILTASKG